MNFDACSQRFSSQRQLTMSCRGAVATSQPLAANAGLTVMQEGGNAFDAALAAAAALTVVEPTSNGLGGDCFALFSAGGKVTGMNASGWLPGSYPRSLLQKIAEEQEKLGPYGWEAVTVPGQLAGWKYLRENYAILDWEKILKPAIKYAREGFPVSPVVARSWKKAVKKYQENLKDRFLKHFLANFSKDGRTPHPGEVWQNHNQADTLEKLADNGVDDFYKGELAEKFIEFARSSGGYISEQDLAEFEVKPVKPLKINYRGHEIFELPPNGQGLIALQALKILSKWEFDNFNSIEEMHMRIEALKQAFADGKKYVADPEKISYNPESLLEDEYIKNKRKKIKNQAVSPQPGNIDTGGTVYLAAMDNKGNSVSFIQSNYTGFGSGIVIPETGIALHNRGYNFDTDKNSNNFPEPRKRPYHTIIPGYLRSQDDKLAGPFGVMGGYMQPQGHMQVLQNLIDYNFNPQEALDAPRWRWQDNKKIFLETTYSANTAQRLADRGHEVFFSRNKGKFGRGQIILRDQNKGIIIGASEPRADGQVAVF